MMYLTIAVLCSVAVSVLLKIPGHNNTEIPVEAQERLMNRYYSDTLPDFEIVLSTDRSFFTVFKQQEVIAFPL